MMEQLRDREQAGRLLAKKLAPYSNLPGVLVLGLPRGGVHVAYVIARALGAFLSIGCAQARSAGIQRIGHGCGLNWRRAVCQR